MIQYTFHNVVPRVKQVGDRPDFLVSLIVGMTATDENGRVAKMDINQVFPEDQVFDESNPYIPFAEMTKEQILELCEKVATQFDLRGKLAQQLQGAAYKPFPALGPGTPNDIFAEPPAPPAVPLAQQQQQIDLRIERERDARKSGGVLVPVGETSYWFHSDDPSRIQYLGIINYEGDLPPIEWKTMTGEFAPMSKPVAQAILAAILSNDAVIFTVGETHRQAAAAAEQPATYDFSANWPAHYSPAPVAPVAPAA